MSENNDYIQLPPLKKDTPSDVVAFMWEYMKVPEDSREKVKNLLKDANENGVKISHQAPTLYDVVPKEEIAEFEELMRKTIADIVSEKRDIWTADTLMYALSVCEDERLKLAINLSFSCSLRLGELLGLTWDCVDISPEAIEENRAYVFINKESQRIRKESLNALDEVDPELLAKVLANPEMRALLNSLAKTMK